MGRGNSIGTENVQREKPLPMKIPLLKNVNNNNYKKCLKETPPCNPEDQGTRNINLSTKSKTLDFQNGNIYELRKINHGNIQISSRTSDQMVADQRSGPLTITSQQDKMSTNVGSRKEVFTFWSSKVKIQESPMVKKSRDHRNVTSKEPFVITPADKARLCENPQPANPFKRKRRQELLSATDFSHIDDYVLSVSSQIEPETMTVKEIVHKITARSSNDIEKLRAIWIWICHNIRTNENAGRTLLVSTDLPTVVCMRPYVSYCKNDQNRICKSYDVDGFLGSSQKLYRTEDVLEKKRGVCAGYAGLCKEMCRETEIRCREVSGFSRGADSCDSVGFHRTKSNHMWNAVELAGHWYLLDACWGAGTVDLQERIFLPRYEDFFFLTDPEDFIETHWPDDPTWQLLESTVSFEDFEQKIFKTSEFFRLQLSIINPNVFHLKTENGEVTISLGCSHQMEYSYKIYKIFDNSRTFVEKTFGILTIQETLMTLRVFPPWHGQYELMIFARPVDAEYPYKWVCSYQIDCPQPKTSLKLPENPYHFWGLNHKARDFGVLSYNPGEDLIMTETSSLKVTFNTSRSLVATFQLAHAEMLETLSQKCLVSQIEDNQLGCHLLLPFHGYYRLSLFVKDQETEFRNVASVLIKCKNPINHNELFPPNLSLHCGPGTNSRRHGLTNPSHTSPVITTTTGKCNITFHTLWDLELYPILENSKGANGLYSLDRHCFLTHLDQKISLTVHLPESGHYKLSIFTKRQDVEEAQEFSHACDYVIHCYSNTSLLPFPKVFTAWGHGCALLQPRVGLLPVESWEIFRVKIPGACKVLVIGPMKTELQLTKNKIWEGKVFTGTDGSIIKIAVKATPNSTTMDIVMSFKTQNDSLDTSSG